VHVCMCVQGLTTFSTMSDIRKCLF